MKKAIISTLAAAILLSTATAAPLGSLDFHSSGGAAAEQVRPMAKAGIIQVEQFFGAPYKTPVSFVLADNRKEFNAAFPAEWGLTETQCWMVGLGYDKQMVLLSPAAWTTEACDHDPKDQAHTQGIITHELAHVYHGQYNHTGDFTGMDDMGWWVEGLAVYASSQMTSERWVQARSAALSAQSPTQLESVWNGDAKYGLAGSLIAYIDDTYGRAAIVAMLTMTKEAEILDYLKVDEATLLAKWKSWLGRKP